MTKLWPSKEGQEVQSIKPVFSTEANRILQNKDRSSGGTANLIGKDRRTKISEVRTKIQQDRLVPLETATTLKVCRLSSI